MLNSHYKVYGRIILFSSLMLLVFIGCTSRYRLDLYMSLGEKQKRVKVERTEFVLDAELGDPFADQKIIAGDGGVVIVTTSARGDKLETELEGIFGFDEYLSSRLLLEVKQPLQKDSSNLVGSSFVHLLGKYDWTPEAKIFMPQEGYLKIDSVTSKNLFGTVDGTFLNEREQEIAFNGRFKVKISR